MRTIVTTLVLAGLLGGDALAAEPDRKGPETPVDRLMAVVNDEPITWFELRRAAAPYVAKAIDETATDGALLDKVWQIKREVLDNLVNDILVYAEAKKLSLTVSNERIDAYIQRIQTANEWTDDEMGEQLRRLGFPSVTDFRRHTEREMMKDQAIRIKVGSRVKIDEGEVEEAFREQVGATNVVQQRRAAHILIKVDAMATEATKAEARTFLEGLRAQIVSGEVTFEEAARQHSQDTNKAAGGDLGWFSPGDFDPDFEKAAYAMAKGDTSQPIATAFGFHLIKLIDTRDKKLEGAEDEEQTKRAIRFKIQQTELERLYRQWVRGLRAQAFVEIKDPLYKRTDQPAQS